MISFKKKIVLEYSKTLRRKNTLIKYKKFAWDW